MKQYLDDGTLIIRPPETADLMFCWEVENDSSQWIHNGMQAPYSLRQLHRFLQDYTADPWGAGQVRMMVMRKTDNTDPDSDIDADTKAAPVYENYPGYENVGIVDLFEISPSQRTAHIGIYILPPHRCQGLGKRAVALMERYASEVLNLRSLLAKVAEGNRASARLFESAGYRHAGKLEGWLQSGSSPIDLHLYQQSL